MHFTANCFIPFIRQLFLQLIHFFYLAVQIPSFFSFWERPLVEYVICIDIFKFGEHVICQPFAQQTNYFVSLTFSWLSMSNCVVSLMLSFVILADITYPFSLWKLGLGEVWLLLHSVVVRLTHDSYLYGMISFASSHFEV